MTKNTACQRDDSGHKSAEKKEIDSQMYKRNFKLVAEVVEYRNICKYFIR